MSVPRRCDRRPSSSSPTALWAKSGREARLHLDECPPCRELYEKELEINALLRSTELADPRSRSVCPMVAMALHPGR